MENLIFYVLSNIRHNSTTYAQGTFIEGVLAEFGELVKDGALRIVEGATSVEHAAEIVASESAEAAKAIQAAQAKAASENTWGPKEAPVTAPETETTTTEETTTETTEEAQKVETTETEKAPEVGQGDQPPAGDAGDNL